MHVLHDVPRYKYGNIQLVIFAFYTQQEPSNDIDLLIVVQLVRVFIVSASCPKRLLSYSVR